MHRLVRLVCNTSLWSKTATGQQTPSKVQPPATNTSKRYVIECYPRPLGQLKTQNSKLSEGILQRSPWDLPQRDAFPKAQRTPSENPFPKGSLWGGADWQKKTAHSDKKSSRRDPFPKESFGLGPYFDKENQYFAFPKAHSLSSFKIICEESYPHTPLS